MNSLVIDPFEFCRLEQTRGGEVPIVELERLAKDLASTNGAISWSLVGKTDALGHPRLGLSVSGRVHLRCQRCLVPYVFELESTSELLIANDEARADQIEEMLGEDEVDVIVAPKQLNALELLEDEALLAIPLSPRHDECPDQALTDVPMTKDKAPSPFDALKKWKR
ncbi:MAG: DUF177 domain-containing protein [Burkholderiales bacterium]|nr:DUF177 domain-containing protein [Burkholderiales bacterium]